MTALILKGVLSYLLGSLIGSLVIARVTGGADIRSLGSGNAGATNALRTQGAKVGLSVLVIDLAKGWIATGLIAPWDIPVNMGRSGFFAWCAPVCGIAVMLGHVYPVFFGFRGGKGVATLVGAVLGGTTRLIVPMVLTWLLVVIVFGYVGLASILAAVALALSTVIGRYGIPTITFGILAAILIVYTHRSNLARMRAGTENRARRLWLLGRTRREA
jgi:acyl phosphate:glycerol-3-phosphate acyltransferase